MSDEVLTASVRTAQLHSDSMGEWVIVDDGPTYDQVAAIPASWEHRQLVTREDAAARFEAVDVVPAELDAIRRVFETLEPLSADARDRALRWLADRFQFATVERVLVVSTRDSERDARRLRVQELWNRRATYKDIAQDLGISMTAAGAMIRHMREAGWELPYRRASREDLAK